MKPPASPGAKVPASPGAPPEARPRPATPQAPRPSSSLWTLPRIDGRPLPNPGRGGWTTLLHHGYGYGCEIPAAWLVDSPDVLNRDRARLMWPPGQAEIRVIVFPFGIYDRPAAEEIRIAEAIWLLQDPSIEKVTLLDSQDLKVGGRPAKRFRRRFEMKDSKLTQGTVETFVEARPKAFGLVLMGPEDSLPGHLAEYERIVRTFVTWNPEQTPSPDPTALPGSSLPPPPPSQAPPPPPPQELKRPGGPPAGADTVPGVPPGGSAPSP